MTMQHLILLCVAGAVAIELDARNVLAWVVFPLMFWVLVLRWL